MNATLSEIRDADSELKLLSLSISKLVSRYEATEAENRHLKTTLQSISLERDKLKSDLDNAKVVIAQLNRNQNAGSRMTDTNANEKFGLEMIELEFDTSPLILTYEEKRVIQQRLLHILEQVNLELQRIG